MHEWHIEFEELEKFMTKICSQLKLLHIGRSSDIYYSNLSQWKQFISQHMPHLVTLRVKFPMNTRGIFPDLHFDTFVHQFTSQFWFERE
jgi:hypothetical protein